MFMRALKTELYRLSRNKMLYISVMIGIAVCVWLFITQMHDFNIHHELITKYGTVKEGLYYPESVFNRFVGLDYFHNQSKILYILLPVLSSLPYAASYFTDCKSGYRQNIITRISRTSYLVSKFTAIFFSGFIVTFTILGTDLILTAAAFPMLPPEAVTSTFPPAFEKCMFLELFLKYPMLYTILYIIIDSMFMGAVAVISLIAGLFIPNSYAVILSGTVIYYAVSYILSVLQIHTQNPYVFLFPYQPFQGISFITILCEFAITMLVCIIIFSIKEGKKKDVLSI